MATNPIGAVNTNSPTTATTGLQSAFDGDAFMKLLLTQLKYQDPMDPMKDQEFMTQLTQMNTLSELQKLNTNMESLSKAQALAEGASLIGRLVQVKTSSGNVVGSVQSVELQGSDVMLDLGTSVAKLDDVLAIGGSA